MHKRELLAFMNTADAPPTELIGFEFSGALLLARQVLGVVTISADVRPAEHDGLHYLGCVQDIIYLRTWDRVYLFPPCFQHLLSDAETVNCITDNKRVRCIQSAQHRGYLTNSGHTHTVLPVSN